MTDATTPAWTHEYAASIAAPPAEVFAALTHAAALREWFAEHVEVEARAGGAYRFWGRLTHGTPTAAQADQRITRLEPDAALSYSWRFDEVPSEVHLRLDPVTGGGSEGQTRVTVRHAFAQDLTGERQAELVDDLWRLVLGNLDAYVRGGAGIVRPDFSDPNPVIRLSIVIDVPRARVFAALTDPAQLNQWIAKQAVVEPRTGGHYSWAWTSRHEGVVRDTGPTRILDYVQDERLVTDWLDWRGDPSRRSSRVAWMLESLGPDRTRVTLVHDRFERTADISDYPFGWPWFLEQLRKAVLGPAAVAASSTTSAS